MTRRTAGGPDQSISIEGFLAAEGFVTVDSAATARAALEAERLTRPGKVGPGIEYHLAHGDWIDLLRANGFEIERLIELQAPPDAQKHAYYDDLPPEWARKWPNEEIWVVRRTTA